MERAVEALRPGLARLNEATPQAARASLLRCCGSSRWAEEMADRRPFSDADALLEAAATLWQGLDQADWREAFAAHPKIGDLHSLRDKFASTADLAVAEQAGVGTATEEVLTALARGNSAYEARFGYIYIVSAAGKSADELLALLEARLGNEPGEETSIAAGEQQKITALRLEVLINAD